MNTLRNTIIALLIALYFILDPHKAGYTHTSQLYTHITYIFAHANLFHLITNLIAFFFAWRILAKLNIIKESIITSLLSAILASFVHCSLFIVHSKAPTVGASGAIYAMIAAPIAGILAKRLKITNRNLFVKSYTCIAIATAIQLLIPNINTTIHIASFLINIPLLFTYYKIKQLCD